MADAIIPHSPTLKNSSERKIFYWHFTLQVLTVRLSFSVQRCHMCVRVGSYTPAAVCFCVCVCVLRAHTGSPVTVCRLALSVRSMNGKHSQLCESPISN